MAWTRQQQDEFRRRVAKMEFEMDDGLQEFYYRNPRIMEAFGRGTLRTVLDQEYFPMDLPTWPAKTMEQAALWPLFHGRLIREQLVDRQVEVDYRLPQNEALLRAKIIRYDKADGLPFDDERVKREALKRTNGVVKFWVRQVMIKGPLAFEMIDALTQLYDFGLTDARTVAAYIERYPDQLDDGRALAATLPSRPSAATVRLAGGYLQYLMKVRTMTGQTHLEIDADLMQWKETISGDETAFLVACPPPKL